jgi:RNA polymerase sigma factor (sigma-70 family)
MSMSDHDLLRQYAHDGSQAAFATLVDRHVNLVYSAARRQVNSPQLAEEVAQSVFIDLARHAPRFNPATPLVAWLHVVARRTAIDIIRRESRRQAREHLAAQSAAYGEPVPPAMKSSLPAWAAVEPLLDEAVDSLDTPDRAAILLRYFENKSLREVGVALGATEDAAQKRVSRAVEQLRAFLLRRGVTVTAAGLVSDLSAHALHVAPAELGATISAAASSLANSVGPAAAVEATKVITMTTLQKTTVVATLAVITSAGVFEASTIAGRQRELERAHQTASQLAAAIQSARTADEAASARLASIERQIDARLAAATAAPPADVALETQMQVWLARVDRLKEKFRVQPNLATPELRLLTSQQWLEVASASKLETADDMRRAMAALRRDAARSIVGKFTSALTAYVAAHDGMLPNEASELAPFFHPPVDAETLGNFEMARTGKAADTSATSRDFVLASKPVDVEYDTLWRVGLQWTSVGDALMFDVGDAQRAYAKANGGQRATAAEQLEPYLKCPVPRDVLEKQLAPRTNTPR